MQGPGWPRRHVRRHVRGHGGASGEGRGGHARGPPCRVVLRRRHEAREPDTGEAPVVRPWFP